MSVTSKSNLRLCSQILVGQDPTSQRGYIRPSQVCPVSCCSIVFCLFVCFAKPTLHSHSSATPNYLPNRPSFISLSLECPSLLQLPLTHITRPNSSFTWPLTPCVEWTIPLLVPRWTCNDFHGRTYNTCFCLHV